MEQVAISEQRYDLSPVGQATKHFELLQRMANAYTSSTIVPEAYRGAQNIGNCIIAMDIATRLNANPLMVMQNLYVVHGNPSFSSKFLVATINACGRFTPIRYEWKGTQGSKDWGCRVYAYDKIHDPNCKEPLYGAWVDIAMADAEGWTRKNGSKWLTMPQLMLQYRASAFWQRVYAPEISMGLITTEEADDIQDAVYTEVKEPAGMEEAMKGDVVSMPVPEELTQQNTQQSAENAPY